MGKPTPAVSALSPNVKTCSGCGETKPVDDFYRRSNGKPRGKCKVCWCADSLASQRANPERYKAYQQTHRSKTTRRARALREKYGMTEEQWVEILVAQGETCAICDEVPRDATGWHSDHDHDTGEFRGILCGLCNRMLGQALDDPARLRAGADYLDAHRKLRVVS